MTRLEFDTRAEAEDYLRDQPGLVTHNPASGMFYYENGDSIWAVLDAASGKYILELHRPDPYETHD